MKTRNIRVALMLILFFGVGILIVFIFTLTGDEGATDSKDGKIHITSHLENVGEDIASGRVAGGTRRDDNTIARAGHVPERRVQNASFFADQEALLKKYEGTDAYNLCLALIDNVDKKESDKTVVIAGELVALGDDAVPLLIEMVSYGDRAIELEALRVLSRIGTPKALAVALGKTLSGTRYESEAMKLIDAFSDVTNPAVSSLLVKIIGETQDRQLNMEIGVILSGMEGSAVVGALAAVMEETEDQSYRQDCAEIMAGLCRPSNILALEEVLETSKDDFVKLAASLALANIGNQMACDVLLDFAGTARERDNFYAQAISRVRSPYGQTALLNILKTPENSTEVRVAAAEALGHYKSELVKNELVNLVSAEKNAAVNAMMQKSAAAINDMITESGNVQNVTGPEENGDFVETKK